MSDPIGGVNVQITGSVEGLTESMEQASVSVEKATTSMGAAFEKAQHRIEHSGVLIAFAVQNMLDGQQTGIQRAMHSIALLGFAFGPVPGAIATAAALTIEHLHNLAHAAEKEVVEFQKRMADIVNAGDVAKLMKEKEELLTGTPATGEKRNSWDPFVKGWSNGLESLKRQWDELGDKQQAAMHQLGGAAEVRALQSQMDDVSKLYQAKAKQLEALDADIERTSQRRAQMAAVGELPRTEIRGGLSDHAQFKLNAEQQKEIKRGLTAFFNEQDKEYAKLERETLDGSLKASGEAARKRMKDNDETAKEENALAVRNQRDMAEAIKRGNADLMAEAKVTAREVSESWVQAAEKVQGAFEQGFSIMSSRGGTLTDHMRKLARSLFEDFARYELKKLEVHIATEKGKAVIDAASAAATKAVMVADATSSITASAAKAAAEAFASQASIPYVGPELGAAAAAASFAEVSAFAGMISAARGFDIPAGLNPVAQLHSQEMVLPASLAERVRDMTDSGGGENHFHFHTNDSRSTEAWARENVHLLGAAALAHIQRGASVPAAAGRR